MSSENGRNISLTVFGESHARAVGAVIEGLPAGEEIDEELIMQFMRRRMGGKPWSTPRREEDKPVILCGLLNGKTTGAALCAIIENNNTRPADYENMKKIPRPSHADYPAFVKYNGANDRSGGRCAPQALSASRFSSAAASRLPRTFHARRALTTNPSTPATRTAACSKSSSARSFPSLTTRRAVG